MAATKRPRHLVREEARAYRQILRNKVSEIPAQRTEAEEATEALDRPSVCFATLSAGMITGELFTGFVSLLTHDIQHSGYLQSFICKKNGGLLSIYRNSIVSEFLNDTPADWLWLVDSDIALAPNTLDLLVEAARSHPEAQIVSGWYVVETPEPTAAIYGWDEKKQDLFPIPVPEETVHVDSVGLGNVMIHRDLLMKMYGLYGLPSPWFHLKSRAATDSLPAHIFGEDHSFFIRTRSDFGQTPLLVPEAHVGHVKSHLLTKEYLDVV